MSEQLQNVLRKEHVFVGKIYKTKSCVQRQIYVILFSLAFIAILFIKSFWQVNNLNKQMMDH
jgi:heme/copper-type cytochrome/quinol oxidase subunit 4